LATTRRHFFRDADGLAHMLERNVRLAKVRLGERQLDEENMHRVLSAASSFFAISTAPFNVCTASAGNAERRSSCP
jgi:hypothetical protein